MFILQRIPMEKFFYKEILCKIFPDFQTWIGFFSTFFEQNQKRRKLRKFSPLELLLCQFSAKSETKKFFTFFTFFNEDFFPQFLSKIRKDENCENLSILNYNWANFQRNRGQKNSSLFTFHFFTFTFTTTTLFARGFSR